VRQDGEPTELLCRWVETSTPPSTSRGLRALRSSPRPDRHHPISGHAENAQCFRSLVEPAQHPRAGAHPGAVRVLSGAGDERRDPPPVWVGGLVQRRRGRSCCPSRAQRLLYIVTVKLTFLPLW
jgi:hypothetical protein